jgi:hypothetical protein
MRLTLEPVFGVIFRLAVLSGRRIVRSEDWVSEVRRQLDSGNAAESAVRKLDHYARLLPIADQRESSDAIPSPTKAPTTTSQDQPAGIKKLPLTCINTKCPRQDSNLRHRL